MSVISARIRAADAAFDAVKNFYFTSRYGERRLEPGICDFTFGNPHEMPLEGIVAAIRERAVPHDKNWFAYKTSEGDPQAFVAERLGRELDLTFEPGDIALTAGAFAAIMVAFRLVVDAGDEVVFSEPAWFCYEPMLLAADAVPRKVALKAPAFDLDLAAIDAAIGPRTRLVIVNTPHNPTGRIYSRELADAEASLAAAHTAAGDALSAFVGSPELASFEGSYPDYADYSLATLQSRSTELSQIAAPTPEQTTELTDLTTLLTSAAGSNLVSTAAAEDALTAEVAADRAALDAAEVAATDALTAAGNKPISDDVREYVDAALEKDGILDYYRTH